MENPEVMEVREGSLVIAKGVTIDSEGGTFPRSGNLTLTDEQDRTFTLRIDSRTDFQDKTIPTEPVDIMGVISQFDTSEPLSGGYQLLAPSFADVDDPNAIAITDIGTLRGQVDENYLPTDTDTLYTVEGVVTTPINLTGSSNGLFYLQDATGGIAVFHSGAEGDIPAQGDKIRITAPVGQFRGLLQLAPRVGTEGHSVEVLSSGNELPAAWELDFGEVENPEVMEVREGSLVIAKGVTIDSEGGTFPRSGNLTITDAEDRTFTLRIDSRTDFQDKTIPTEPVDIMGVISQFDSEEPLTGGYQLLAPSFADVDDPNAIAITDIGTLRGQVDENYLPTDTDTLYTVEGVVTTPINLTGSSNGLFYLQDATGGIAVFHSGAEGDIPAQGDKIRITAPVGQFRGLLQLAPRVGTEGHSVEVLSSGNELPAAWELDFGEVENPEVMEVREGSLVIAKGVTIDSEGGTFPRSGNLTITDEQDRTFTLRIDSRTDFQDKTIPTEPVDIMGVISQFDSEEPLASGYQLLAPSFADVDDGGEPGLPLTSIQEIKALVDMENYLPTDTETLFRVQGVVTTDINLTTPSNGLFYMQSDNFGIAVFHDDAEGDVPAKGDLVEVIAPLGHFNGLFELLPVVGEEGHSVSIISSGNEIPEATEIDFSKLEDFAYFESIEGLLVKATDVEIQSDDAAFPQSGNLVLLNNTGNPLNANGFTLRIDSRTDIGGQAIPAGPATITGVLAQFDTSDPRTSNYQIIPNTFKAIDSKNKAPIVGFDVMLQNQLRDSEPANSQYTEYSLLPGETIVIEVAARDFASGNEIDISTEGELPDGAIWNIPSLSGEELTAEFTFTAGEQHRGNLVAPVLIAANENAENRNQWNIYVPELSEQNLVISEFLANPSASEEDLHYNPLKRDLEGVEEYIPWQWDEFIELANLGEGAINLGGWQIGDANEIRHIFFESFLIDPSTAGIIYGGPLNGVEPQLDGIPTIPASENRFGFGLNNSGGDIIRLYNADGNLVQRVVFSGDVVSDTASVTFTPDVFGLPIAQDEISDLSVSPGTWINGTSFDTHTFVPRLRPLNLSASISEDNQISILWDAQAGVIYEVLATQNLGDDLSLVETDLTFDDGSGEYSASLESDFRFFVIRRKSE